MTQAAASTFFSDLEPKTKHRRQNAQQALASYILSRDALIAQLGDTAAAAAAVGLVKALDTSLIGYYANVLQEHANYKMPNPFVANGKNTVNKQDDPTKPADWRVKFNSQKYNVEYRKNIVEQSFPNFNGSTVKAYINAQAPAVRAPLLTALSAFDDDVDDLKNATVQLVDSERNEYKNWRDDPIGEINAHRPRLSARL